MANRPRHKVIEYENDDLAPVYVESVQGMRTGRGSLQIMFFSDYIGHQKNATELTVTTPPGKPPGTVDINVGDPFRAADGSFRVVRRIEANLILSLPALKALVPWLQLKIDELESQDK